MNSFGFNHKNGIEVSKLLTLKNVRENVYSRDNQFHCFLCYKQLRTSGDKNNHLKTDCGVKPQENVEKYFQESNLSLYEEKQPLVNIENSFSCDKCLNTFSLKGSLTRH